MFEDNTKGLSFGEDQIKGAALAHQGGGHPLKTTGIVQKGKAAQEERISHGRQVYLLSVCQ